MKKYKVEFVEKWETEIEAENEEQVREIVENNLPFDYCPSIFWAESFDDNIIITETEED